MARTPGDDLGGNIDTSSGNQTQTIQIDGQEVISLPSADFVKEADILREGQDLILEGPDGSVVVIEGYFNAEPAPLLQAPDGQALSPQLVDSFVHHAGPVQYAQKGSLADESPVGQINEVSGNSTVTRTDGSTETITIGTPIYEGDVIETSDDGAVNIVFIDETSFAVSQNAKLAIDEYVFDPATETGSTDFSVLRGLFVFTSGLIGRDDPDDVNIDTPMGSIGIRGTVIVGDVDTGQITVMEGAIVMRGFNGNEITMAEQFDTGQFDPATGDVIYIGKTDPASFSDNFDPLKPVSPNLFSGLNDNANDTNQDNSSNEGPAEALNTDDSAGDNANNAAGTEDAGSEDAETSGEEQTAGVAEESGEGQEGEGAPGPEGENIEGSEQGEGTPGPDNVYADTTFGGPDAGFNGIGQNGLGQNGSGPNGGGFNGGGPNGGGFNGGGGNGSGFEGSNPPPPLPPLPVDIVIDRSIADDDLGPGGLVAIVSTANALQNLSFSLVTAQINGAPALADFQIVGSGANAAIRYVGATPLQPTDVIDFGVRAVAPNGQTKVEGFSITVDELIDINNVIFTDIGAPGVDESVAGGTDILEVLVPVLNDEDPANEGVSFLNLTVLDAGSNDITANFSIQPHPSGDANRAIIRYDGPTPLDFETMSNLRISVQADLDPNEIGGGVTESVVGNYVLPITDTDDTAPTVTNNGATVNEGSTTILTTAMLDGNDVDTSDPNLTFTVTTGTVNGTLELFNGSAWNPTSTFTQADLAAGNVRYIHDDSETTVDSFTFDLTDGVNGGPTGAVFNITVNPVDDIAPTLVAGPNDITGGVTEGGSIVLTLAQFDATDADTAQANIIFEIAVPLTNGQLELVSNPGVAITQFTHADLSGGQVVYQHDGSNNFADSFDFNVRDPAGNVDGGGPYTFNITGITNVNDLPVGGVGISGAATEGSLLTADTGSLTDADGLGVFTYQWEVSPDGATGWAPIGGATASTYTLTNADSGNYIRVIVSYTDGEGTGEVVTSSVTTQIAGVNDAPTLDLDTDDSSTTGADFITGFTEDGGPIFVADDTTVGDVDDTNMESATITLTNNLDGGLEFLEYPGGDQTVGGITISGSGTNVITLTGTDTLANYVAILQNLQYDNLSDSPNLTPRTVTFTVNDGDVNSNIATTTINITDNPADNDVFASTAGNDTIVADGGNDTFQSAAGDGDDNFAGGGGDDTFIAADNDGADILAGDGDVTGDTYDASLSTEDRTYLLNPNNDGQVTGLQTDTFTSIEIFQAGSGDDDFILGTNAATYDVDGGAGTNDSLDFSNLSSTVNVDLSTGITTMSIGSVNFANIETFIGSSVADTFTMVDDGNSYSLDGDAGADALDASDGSIVTGVDFDLENDQVTINGGGVYTILNDSFSDFIGSGNADTFTAKANGLNYDFDGGAGVDVVEFTDATGAVSFDLAIGSQAVGGGFGTYTISNIEDVTGSAFNDTLRGDNSVNTIMGLGGDDTLRGSGGADIMDGGAGTDTADYSAFGFANNITSLILDSSGTAGLNSAGGNDSLMFIENIIGTDGADTIDGSADAAANVIDGHDDNDILTGGAGDTLIGGLGNDSLNITSDNIDLQGGAGIDRVNMFQNGATFDSTNFVAVANIEDFSLADAGSTAATFNLDVVDGLFTNATAGSLNIHLDNTDTLDLDFSSYSGGGTWNIISGDLISGGTVVFQNDTTSDTINVIYTAGATITENSAGAAPMPFSLNALSGEDGFIISDDIGREFAGSLSSMGDRDGDGFDDMLFIQQAGSATTSDYFILNGRSGGHNDFSLGGSPPPEFTPNNIGFDTGLGNLGPIADVGISFIGDFDNDGDMDFIIAAPNADTNSSTGADTGQIKIVDESGNLVLELEGLGTDDLTGQSIAGVGDIDGDGIADVLIGAPGADGAGTDRGSAYLLFGNGHLDPTLDIADFGTGVITSQAVGTNVLDIQDGNGGDIAALRLASAGAPNVAEIVLSNYDDANEVFGSQVTVSNGTANARADAFDYTSDISMHIDGAGGRGYVVTDLGVITRFNVPAGTVADPTASTFDSNLVGALDITVLGTDGYIVKADGTVGIATAINGTIAPGGNVQEAGPVDSTITGAEKIFNDGTDIYVLVDDSANSGIYRVDLGVPAGSAFIAVDTGGIYQNAIDVVNSEVGADHAYVLIDDGGDIRVEIIDLVGDTNVGVIDTFNLQGITAASASIDITDGTLTISGNDGSTNGTIYTFDIGSGNEADPELLNVYSDAAIFNNTDVVGIGSEGEPVIYDGGNLSAIDTVFDGMRIDGISDNDALGMDVSSIGDIDGDGQNEIAISTPGAGEVQVILSSTVQSQSSITLGTDTIRITGVDVGTGSDLNIPLFDIGDVTGDGISDFALAETNGVGALRIFSGAALNAVGVGNSAAVGTATMTVNAAAGFEIVGGGSAGDFNGDGIADGVIAMRNTAGGSEREVDIYVIFGGGPAGTYSPGGANDLDDPDVAFKMTYDIPAAQDFNDFDFEFTSAGDINGDGFDDLAIGLPDLDAPGGGADDPDGSAFMVYGKALGAGNYVHDGLISLHKMDEAAGTTAADSVAGNNDGTFSGGAAVTSVIGADGSANGALSFDGTNDHIVTAGSSGIAGGDFTIALWVNRSGGFGTGQTFLSEDDGSGPNDMMFGFTGGNNVIFGIDGLGPTLTSSTAITAAGWNHIAISYDNNTGDYTLYVNGAQDGSASGQNNFFDSGGNLYIGSLLGTNWFNGALDDLRIYNVALGDEEIGFLADSSNTQVFSEIPDQDSSLGSVVAGAASQILVGYDAVDTLNDGGFNGTTFRAGAGDDFIEISNNAFDSINGGGGFDILDASQNSLDFTAIGSEEIQRIEAIALTDGGNAQTMTLTLENIFNILEASDDGVLKLAAGGDIMSAANRLTAEAGNFNLLEIDSQGAAGTGVLANAEDLASVVGGSYSGTDAQGFHLYEIGNYTLKVDTLFFDGAGTNVNIVG